jgi:hypothetical protein
LDPSPKDETDGVIFTVALENIVNESADTRLIDLPLSMLPLTISIPSTFRLCHTNVIRASVVILLKSHNYIILPERVVEK